MLTEKDYCDYDTCVALYELGLSFEDASLTFERNLLTNRYEEIPKPSLYDAQKWLREERGLHVEISIFANNYDVEIITTHGDKNGLHDVFIEKCGFKSYEEAFLEGIKEAVKILKNN